MSGVTSKPLNRDLAAEVGGQQVFEIKPLDLPKGMARRGVTDYEPMCWDGLGDSGTAD
jgi:hypothetical protein